MYVKRIHIWLTIIVWAIVLLGCNTEEEPTIDIAIEYYSNNKTGCKGVQAITTPLDGMQYISYNYTFDGEYFYDEEDTNTTFEPVKFTRCHQGRAIIELHVTAIDLKGTKQKQSWYKN